LITVILPSIMNNMRTVLIGALSIDAATSHGVVHAALDYANVNGSDLRPTITPIDGLATLLSLDVLSSKAPRFHGAAISALVLC
jgi:arsenical pump membrane protein